MVPKSTRDPAGDQGGSDFQEKNSLEVLQSIASAYEHYKHFHSFHIPTQTIAY